VGNALMISRGLHLVSIAALLAVAWFSTQLSVLFWIAASVTCALLLFEHALVWGGKTKQLNMAFFIVNGVISMMLGAAGIADVIARG
jgi:4-hydroxybenzoate polyprenyltransferase